MAAPRRIDSGRPRNSQRALAHPPGCWATHDLCALEGARDLSRVQRDQAHGRALGFEALAAKLRHPDLVPDAVLLQGQLLRAREILRANR